MEENMKLIVHTDGGARGNPGPAAVGVVIESENKTIAAFGKRIGETTNNVAEYTAVIEALKEVESLKSQVKSEIHFILDSNLVVQQLNGKFKVKDSTLRELLMQTRMLEQEIGAVVIYAYVPREQNKRADFLVNKALDGHPHVSFS